MFAHYEIIETKSKTQHKAITFEEIDFPVIDTFPFASRFIRYRIKINAHWLIRAVWFFPIMEICFIVLLIVDLAILACKNGFPFMAEKIWAVICWLCSQIWNTVVAIASRIWEVVGESVKAFLVTMLKGLAAVIVILLVVALIKSGSFSNMIDTIPRWLGF